MITIHLQKAFEIRVRVNGKRSKYLPSTSIYQENLSISLDSEKEKKSTNDQRKKKLCVWVSEWKIGERCGSCGYKRFVDGNKYVWTKFRWIVPFIQMSFLPSKTPNQFPGIRSEFVVWRLYELWAVQFIGIVQWTNVIWTIFF